jgi:chromosome segregation ATPase
LSPLEKEIESLERQLAQVPAPVFVDAVCDPDDLDSIYREQIQPVSDKIEKLKRVISETRAEKNETERRQRKVMNEKRSRLEDLRSETNRRRKEIETNQCAIRQAVRPYMKEIEALQAKHAESLRAAERCQDELNAARSQADSRLQESEHEFTALTDELSRAVVAVEEQSLLNDRQREKHDRLRKEVERLRAMSLGYERESMDKGKRVTEMRQRVAELRIQCESERQQLQVREEEVAQAAEKLREKVRTTEARLPLHTPDDVGTSPMNESEIRESVAALETEYASLGAEIQEVRAQYEQAEAKKKKIAAALELITEMDDEEACMTGELGMLRKHFSATLKMLNDRRARK